jgi:hypothetical protein
VDIESIISKTYEHFHTYTVHVLTQKDFCGFVDVEGHAVAQAVSCWLPIVAAWVLVWAASGVCGGQNGTGAGFL